MRPREITQLKNAIRARHDCDARYVITIPANHLPSNQSGWDGRIAVFELIGHPSAERCYAWTVRKGHRNEFVTFLLLPPVDSPRAAVEMWNSQAGVAT